MSVVSEVGAIHLGQRPEFIHVKTNNVYATFMCNFAHA